MKLDELFTEFEDACPEDALEILMEFADRLAPLSAARAAEGEPANCRIQECQTPVFLWVDVQDGRVQIEAMVPEKSPTVRGFVALLAEGLAGATAAEVAGLPDDLLPKMSLDKTLGMTRERGFKGIVSRIKHAVARATTPPHPDGDFL